MQKLSPIQSLLAQWYRLQVLWIDITQIWVQLHHHDDLKRLVQWARHKKLSGPNRYYSDLLIASDDLLFRQRLRHPRASCFLGLIFTLKATISPPPRYHAKGSAAKYKLRNYSLNWRPSEKRVLSY